jgi:nuclear pore complex protein Nup54
MFQYPQQTHLSSLLQSGLGGNPSAFGSLGAASQTDLARSRLAAYGITSIPNEKNTFEQVQTLVKKWDPNSQETLMQTYLYNAVNAAYAPFYYRNPDEGEKDYEEALANKPPPFKDNDGANMSYVPIIARGFHALSDRVEEQAKSIHAFRVRLHEINNSLNAIMSTHQQSLTVRLENARRQHAALSQRALRLAVKAQVLRNRGYPLDVAEESLRKSLQNLEGQVFDPHYAAREEEIWARMVALRDRARWLEEEVKRLAAQKVGGGKEAASGNEEISDEVITKTKKILADYDGQIRHLGKELDEVRKEFAEWELAQPR